jgi:PucR C-terminal helix-turn-helix domain
MGPEISGVPRMAGVPHIDGHMLDTLQRRLPEVATRTIEAVTEQIPGYRTGLSETTVATIHVSVQMALAGFLKVASGGAGDTDPSTPHGPTLEGAYALGQGEARSARSLDSLLSAYRVGARVAWRELAQSAAEAGMDSATMAEFAELLFAFIDELSAASLAGHSDELTNSGRVQERHRERLGQHLLDGAGHEVLIAAAGQAGWTPPESLTAVILPSAQVRSVLAALSDQTLQLSDNLPSTDLFGTGQSLTLLMVPDAEGPGRRQLVRDLIGRRAILGPPRPWMQVRSSYDRAARTARLAGPPRDQAPIDSEDHLTDLILAADPDASSDLAARVLAPLADLPQATRERLSETLLSWLLHQGRREDVAADLHVHAQTVRYRMGQLRELFGDQLSDPRTIRELILVLPPRAADQGPAHS